jgi:hypothetical protein
VVIFLGCLYGVREVRLRARTQVLVQSVEWKLIDGEGTDDQMRPNHIRPSPWARTKDTRDGCSCEIRTVLSYFTYRWHRGNFDERWNLQNWKKPFCFYY